MATTIDRQISRVTSGKLGGSARLLQKLNTSTLNTMKRFALLLLCLFGSAFAGDLEQLQADLRAALPNDRGGIAIGHISPETEPVLFVGNSAFTETTLFEYGSITKVFTAILLAELAGEGKVKLTDNLNVYLPEAVRDEKWQDVTLQDLATHTAGLPRMPQNMNFLYVLRNIDNPSATYDEAMLFKAVNGVKLEPPGELNSYSNFGFGLLGALLERATDTPYKTMVETRLFAPLSMTGAIMTGWGSENVAPPLTREGDEASYWDFDALAGAGAARGSVADMMKFLKASIGACTAPGALAKANCLAQQGTQVRAFKYAAQGLGWVRSTSPAGEVVWHNGGTGGYSSFLGFNVETGEGLVLLANVAGLEEVTSLGLNFLAGLE